MRYILFILLILIGIGGESQTIDTLEINYILNIDTIKSNIINHLNSDRIKNNLNLLTGDSILHILSNKGIEKVESLNRFEDLSEKEKSLIAGNYLNNKQFKEIKGYIIVNEWILLDTNNNFLISEKIYNQLKIQWNSCFLKPQYNHYGISIKYYDERYLMLVIVTFLK